jgi:carboxyl-terminal processing protease
VVLRLVALILAAAAACSPACSSKAPASGEPRPVPLEVRSAHAAGEEGAAAANLPPPDPREAALSAAVLQLFEQEHLLRKKIDDDVSRRAFDAYLDQLDGSKMFLLRAHRDALARFADQIDDQLRSGSLELAHEGARTFAARIAVVDQMVASLLGAPFDLTDEEWHELDPKKVQLATSEDELRERWRRRLELEVLERTAQMEARLEAAAKASLPTKPGKGKPAPKKPAAKPPTSPTPTPPAPPDDDDDDDAVRMPVAEIPTTPEGREAKARTDLASTYASRFARLRTAGPLDAAADLVNAVSAALDPHTTYMPPADKANFDIRMSGSLEGIGAVLREKDHFIEIVEIVPGGAAWRHGGLATGDLILSVINEGKDPVDVFDMRIDEVVKMIRGPKGTVVRLRIRKPSGQEQTVAITRDVVVIEAAYARGALLQRKGQPSYGYIHLPSFYGGKGSKRNAADDVQKLLREMAQRKVPGVVLDMRSNGGGILGDAIELTGHLIDRGPVVQVQDSRGKREVLSDDSRGTEYDGPVVVLVDRFSASASEIVAGALQDYKRAVIVGTGPTHGKGTVQMLADLDRATRGQIELGVLKLTIQQYFRVTGSSTQREGVIPDIVLPDPAGHVDSGERELDNAIPWSQIDSAPYRPVDPGWRVNGLIAKSATRVAKDPLLTKVATATELLRARRNDTRVPLARPAWEARRKQHRAALEAASPDLEKAPPRFTVKSMNGELEPPKPGPNGQVDDRLRRWRDSLARDPWVDESLNVLADMTAN